MAYLKINPAQHRIVETPVSSMLRRHTGDPNIFTYWHTKKRVWVCATWMSKPSRICDEHFLWKGGPNDCPPGKIRGFLIQQTQEYRSWLNEKAKKARLYEKELEDDAISWAEERASVFDYCKRKARQTMQDHFTWWDFCKQDRRG